MPTIYDVPSTYATISAAIAALPADMTGQGVHEIVVEAGDYLELVHISGRAGESASDYIVLRAAVGAESSGIIDSVPLLGVRVQGGGNFTDAVKTTSDFSVIRDIQVHTSSLLENGFRVDSHANNVTFLNCRAVGGAGTTSAGFVFSGGSNTKAINCISNARGTAGGNGFKAFNVSQTITLYNCIAYNCKADGFEDDAYATLVCYNCVGVDCEGYDFDSSVIGSNNCSTDGNAPGVDSLINQTLASMNFVSDGVDFHIDEDSILWNVGIDQSAVFTEDVDGNPMGDIFPMGVHQPLASPFGGGGVGGGQLSLGLFLKL